MLESGSWSSSLAPIRFPISAFAYVYLGEVEGARGIAGPDLCLYSPESYALDEKHDFCYEMIETNRAMLDAMRADFEQMTPDARSELLAMLCQSGVESPKWWWDVLVGEGDPMNREFETF